MRYIDIRDFKKYDDEVIINGQKIKILIQKTGYGYKKFFKCCSCGKRREHLYLENNILKGIGN